MSRLLAYLLVSFVCVIPAAAQTDAWQGLKFLEGTWEAKGASPQGASASGAYSFVPELGGHVLARHSTASAGCKGPVTFNCEHGDLLYVYLDGPGAPLKAIYFDNEGHTIHYNVTTPAPGIAVFLSEPGHAPQFRLTYELKGVVMEGKFQMMMPGQKDWTSYLEWNGAKR